MRTSSDSSAKRRCTPTRTRVSSSISRKTASIRRRTPSRWSGHSRNCSDPRPMTGLRAENHLVERLAIIAAIEHITAFLGDWVLNAKGLDKAGMHPTMLDLLRWHGAEEVEHRSVAYDVMRYFDKRETRRIRTQIVVTPVLVWLWIRGTRFLMRNDPETCRSGPQPSTPPHCPISSRRGKRGTVPHVVRAGQADVDPTSASRTTPVKRARPPRRCNTWRRHRGEGLEGGGPHGDFTLEGQGRHISGHDGLPRFPAPPDLSGKNRPRPAPCASRSCWRTSTFAC